MDQQRGIGTVVNDLLDEGRALLRSEIKLAQAEMGEKAAAMKTGIVLAAIGAVLLIAGLVLLLEAAVGGLMEAGLSLAISSLIIGAAVIVIGGIALGAALARFKAKNLTPTRTARQLSRDASLTREVHA